MAQRARTAAKAGHRPPPPTAELEARIAALSAELREARDQQTATAEILQIINSSPADLAPVFDAMLHKALRLCEAAFGFMATYDGERFHVVAHRSLPPAYADFVRVPYRPGAGTATLRVAQGEAIVHIADLTEDEGTRQGDPARLAMIEMAGGRTQLVLGLRKDDALLGGIVIYRTEVRPFSDKQIALLQNFAAQAVIAMENARLLTETREALERQTATAEILRVISSSPTDVQPTFDAIARAAKTLTGATAGGVFRFDGRLIHFVAHHGWTAAELDAVRGVFPLPPGRGSITARAILTRAVAHVADMTVDPEFEHMSLAQDGLRTMLAVPMLRDGVPIGAIVVQRRHVELFSDKQIDLLKTFADQAVIAIENVRLFNELNKRTNDLEELLEYQTATSDVLKVISRSTFDIQPVLDTLAETAARLCDAGYTAIYRRDGEAYRMAAVVAFSPETMEAALKFQAFLEHHPLVPGRGSIVGRVALEGRAVHVADTASDPEYIVGVARTLGNMGTVLGVPLLREGEPIGVIILARHRVQPFTDRQIELVRTFADQAVIAIENARLITETREALEQQTATAEVLGVINSSPGELQPVFDAILEKAHSLCGVAFGTLQLYDGETFRPAAVRGLSEAFTSRLRQGFRGSDAPIARPLLDGARYVHIADLAEVARSHRASGGRARRHPHRPLCAVAAGRHAVRDDRRRSPGGSPVLRQADRAAAKLCGAGGHRDGECAPVGRVARVARSANGDRRGAGRHQFVARRSRPGVRRDAGQRARGSARPKPVICCASRTANSAERPASVCPRISTSSCRSTRRCRREIPRNSVPYRMAASRSPVHVHDIREDVSYRLGAPAEVAAAEAGIRTALFVPLLKEGEVVGCFVMHRMAVRPFSDKQIALLENFAAQAVIAMENARLLTETREALERQTATAEILRVISSSPTDVQPTFEAIAAAAARLSGAVIGAVFTYDSRLLHLAAGFGWAPGELEMVRGMFPMPPDRGTTTGRAILTRQVAQVEDMSTDPEYGYPSLAQSGGHTVLSVPMLRDSDPIGTITVQRRQVVPFSDKQIDLLKTFADQAVIAIENVRLFNELNERTDDLQESLEYQTATSDVLKVISRSTFDLQPVLDTLIQTATRLCAADAGGVTIRDGEAYRYLATYALDETFAAMLRGRTFVPDRGSMVGRVALTGGIVHVEDAAADPDYGVPEVVTQANMRTLLGAPLLRDGIVAGTLTLTRSRVEPFTERQIELVRTFADQAVIAIENTRLITETREALEQQTATAEILQVINASPGDLAPVFDAMLDKATRLCEAGFGLLWTYDGERFRAAALHGVPPAFAEFVREPVPVADSASLAEVARGDSFVHVADWAATEAYRAGSPLRRAVVDLGGARTGVTVPLRKDDALLGIFVIYRQEVRPFSDKQIALLQNFAAQAVIAMENARLITETREALEQQTATAEILQVINSSPGDLAPVFDAVLEKAHSLCGAAFGALVVRDGTRFHAVALRGLPEPFAEIVRRGFEPGPGNPAWRLVQGEPFAHIADAAEVAARSPDDPVPRAAVELAGVRTILFVPLRKDNTLLGYITAYRQEVRPFTDKQVALLQNFAAQAVIAMDNARLLSEIRRRQAELSVTFDNMGDGVAMFDSELRLAAWNRNFQELLDLPDAFLAEPRTYKDYIRILLERGEIVADDIEAELQPAPRGDRPGIAPRTHQARRAGH